MNYENNNTIMLVLSIYWFLSESWKKFLINKENVLEKVQGERKKNKIITEDDK